MEPRVPLPASDASVAMYLQSVANSAKTFAPVKAASAAIAFFQKVNLFDHEPTQCPAACLVRNAAMRRFGLNPKNRKEPFEWDNVVLFAEAYGVRQQGYCHLVVASITVIMFGAMCRYDDASGLRWRNLRFVEDGSGFEITIEKRKNCQYRQGNKVLVASCRDAVVCPMRLLLQLRAFTGGAEDLHVFRGFNGRLVAKNPGKTAPGPDKISYDQMLRFMGLWFSGVLGIPLAQFKKQFATQSGRSGSASAAANAGVSAELWGQHGDWHSLAAQKVYMKSDTSSLLSVSKAAMRLPGAPTSAGRMVGEPVGVPPDADSQVEEDVRTECESAGAPPIVADEGLPPEVTGVPSRAFQWSRSRTSPSRGTGGARTPHAAFLG